jgi:thiamine biosynthesis lipoprotein
MSTMVRISIDHELYANDLMSVFKLFQLIENTCSRFRKDSELSVLNKQIGEEQPVSKELFSILKKALQFYHETDGLFNPGILKAIEMNGYSKSIEHIREQRINISVLAPTAVKVQPLVLHENKQSITLFTKIDLGGIAKGWVIDRAAELLEKNGYGFINVGGDIRIFGTLPRPLNIGIEDPFDQTKMISSIQAENGAVATSTTMKRRWLVKGEWKHHLIDPRTSLPSESTIVSATVTAPTALEADVLAKTILLSGKEHGLSVAAQKGAQVVLIDQDGEVLKGGI